MLYDNYKEILYKQDDKDFGIYNLLDFEDEIEDEDDDFFFEFHDIDDFKNEYEVDENEAWFMKYISETLDYYLKLNNINLRLDYYDTFEDVFIKLNFDDSEKERFEYYYEYNFEQISNLFSYVLHSIINTQSLELDYNEIHINIKNYLI